MSLISLLIALGMERLLQSSCWHFNFYYSRYAKFATGFVSKDELANRKANVALFAFIPAFIIWGLLEYIDETIIEFAISTLVLITCLGCQFTRQTYKNYLNAAMRGDEVAVTHHQMALQQDQVSESESFGQTLVWMNYQYYMAPMLIFIFLGLPAVVFYRILVGVSNNALDDNEQHVLTNEAAKKSRDLLTYIDFIPVRFVALGYMLVGHFSKASTVWLEGMLNFSTTNRQYLNDVARASEEITVVEDDLTSEPLGLVQLAKRNVFLLMAAIAFMTIAGILS